MAEDGWAHAEGASEPSGDGLADSLIDAIISLNVGFDLPSILQRFLEVCTEQTGAQYAAINVLDEDGHSRDFYFTGMDPTLRDRLGHAPSAVGVLSRIPHHGSLVVDSVPAHPSYRGLPEGHPDLSAFLGTALRVREHVFGYLYLANKDGGFDARDEAIVRALAAAASVAIDNSAMYENAMERERWLTASQGITTRLLANPGDEEALQAIVEAAQALGRATAATLVLPGVGDTWVMEVTAGDKAGELLGLVLPDGGYALGAIHSGKGSFAPEPPGPVVLEEVRDFGPSLYAPLRAEGRTIGLLMLWRDRKSPPFGQADLDTAQLFANQAALALSVAELRHVQNVTALLEERQRIADDLHDLVSQELFAAAMQLERMGEQAPGPLQEALAATLEHIRSAQRDVRGVVSTLAREKASEPLEARVRRELVLAQDALGFAPETVVDIAAAGDLDADHSLAHDLVAVLRESLSNVAQHARATRAAVEVRAADGRLWVRVEDDGIGPPATLGRHSGTSNLAGRALRRGGSFSMEPAGGAGERPGCVVEWSVPVTGAG